MCMRRYSRPATLSVGEKPGISKQCCVGEFVPTLARRWSLASLPSLVPVPTSSERFAN